MGKKMVKVVYMMYMVSWFTNVNGKMMQNLMVEPFCLIFLMIIVNFLL